VYYVGVSTVCSTRCIVVKVAGGSIITWSASFRMRSLSTAVLPVVIMSMSIVPTEYIISVQHKHMRHMPQMVCCRLFEALRSIKNITKLTVLHGGSRWSYLTSAWVGGCGLSRNFHQANALLHVLCRHLVRHPHLGQGLREADHAFQLPGSRCDGLGPSPTQRAHPQVTLITPSNECDM
jgi:hypothetical protein